MLGSLVVLVACSGMASQGQHRPQVRISNWTSPHGQVHEVAIWRGQAESADIERVYVVPGSGCTGMAPILPSYFEGLRAREVIVLHKPHVRASDWPRPTPCRADFVEQDDLATWSQAWRVFLAQDLLERPVPPSRVMLVGISEGAEVLPGLMADRPDLGLAVLLGSTGLDPWEAWLLQLQREGDLPFSQAVQARLDTAMSDTTDHALLGGRTLRYWRTLRHWPVAQPLQQSPVRALVIMGDADAVQAPEGLRRLAMRHARPGLCTRLLPGADHGLRVSGRLWPGLWLLVQGLWAAEGPQAFAQRCEQPD